MLICQNRSIAQLTRCGGLGLNPRFVRILFDAGAKLDLLDNGGRSALYYFMGVGCQRDMFVVTLLKYGADPNVGKSPLELAKSELAKADEQAAKSLSGTADDIWPLGRRPHEFWCKEVEDIKRLVRILEVAGAK